MEPRLCRACICGHVARQTQKISSHRERVSDDESVPTLHSLAALLSCRVLATQLGTYQIWPSLGTQRRATDLLGRGLISKLPSWTVRELLGPEMRLGRGDLGVCSRSNLSCNTSNCIPNGDIECRRLMMSIAQKLK